VRQARRWRQTRRFWRLSRRRVGSIVILAPMDPSFAHPEHPPAVPAHDRAEIAEVLFRFAAGIDLHDRALLESVLAPEATVDFTSPAHCLGASLPVFEGRQAVADAVMASTERLDTTHTVNNLRVLTYDGKRAVTGALVAEHYLPRDGSGRHLVLMNSYQVELVSELAQWIIHRMKVDCLWFNGDPDVLWLPSVLAARAVGPISLSTWKGRKRST